MWHIGGEIERPDCFPVGKDDLTVFTILVELRLNRDNCITNNQLRTLKHLARKYFIEQSAAIGNLDVDGYRCNNPDLEQTRKRPDMIVVKTTRIIAALLHKLCPSGARTKDGMFFVPPALPPKYHKLTQLSNWASTTTRCAGTQPTEEEVMSALIEERSTFGKDVHLAIVPPVMITYLYTHRGSEDDVTLKENVVMMCTKEGGEIIFARNTNNRVELQTRVGNAKGEFHAPREIFSSNVRSRGVNGVSVLRIVYFTFNQPLLRWFEKMGRS